EDAHVLTRTDEAVIKIPQFGALAAGIPLPEFVAQGENAFFRSRPLFVTPSTTDHGVELVLGDSVQQRDGLQAVSGSAWADLFAHAAAVDRRLDARDDQPLSELVDAAIAKGERFGEVVTRVDVHDREGERRG